MAIKQQYNQINLGTKQYLTLICLSLNEFQSSLSKNLSSNFFNSISPLIYIRYKKSKTFTRILTVEYNARKQHVEPRTFDNLPERYKSTKQPQR